MSARGKREAKFHHANENARSVAPPHSAQVTATSINRRAKRLARRFGEIPELEIKPNHCTLFVLKEYVENETKKSVICHFLYIYIYLYISWRIGTRVLYDVLPFHKGNVTLPSFFSSLLLLA